MPYFVNLSEVVNEFGPPKIKNQSKGQTSSNKKPSDSIRKSIERATEFQVEIQSVLSENEQANIAKKQK